MQKQAQAWPSLSLQFNQYQFQLFSPCSSRDTQQFGGFALNTLLHNTKHIYNE